MSSRRSVLPWIFFFRTSLAAVRRALIIVRHTLIDVQRTLIDAKPTQLPAKHLSDTDLCRISDVLNPTPGYIDTTPFPATPIKWTDRAIYRVDDDASANGATGHRHRRRIRPL
jgi:hypothetical protein